MTESRDKMCWILETFEGQELILTPITLVALLIASSIYRIGVNNSIKNKP